MALINHYYFDYFLIEILWAFFFKTIIKNKIINNSNIYLKVNLSSAEPVQSICNKKNFFIFI